MATVPEIIAAMREAAPPGCQVVADSVIKELQSLTRALTAAMLWAEEEPRRFAAIRGRCIAADDAELRAWLRGKSILVTGGTGCIGSMLLSELSRRGPRRLVSVSRGLCGAWPTIPQAEYLRADVTDKAGFAAVLGQVRPDVVFHLAAQRDPGLAECEVQRTVSTNILGTRNVAQLCAEFGIADVICATTGKALRPYSREVYTATKRSAEWILAKVATQTDSRLTAVRFTHVADNSIIYDRLRRWAAASGVVRLHDPGTMFYAQSALESAQLLMWAGLRGRHGSLRICAINDLGEPVSLLDLAAGVLLQTGSDSPIYFSGFDPGYERVPFPGLYDPATAGDISPLLSAFEAIDVEHLAAVGIDTCTAAYEFGKVPEEQLVRLERACRESSDRERVRHVLDELAWLVFDATLAALPARTLSRATLLASPREAELSRDHRKMLAGIRKYACADRMASA